MFFYTLDQMSKNQKYLLEFFRKISRKIPILYPDHEFKILFNWFIVILLFIDISYAGFLLIIEREDKSNYHLNNFEKLIVLTPKIFFFIEIFLNFFTAYYDKGILVKRKRSIIQHFIKTEFPLDVFSIILPFFFEQILNGDLALLFSFLRIFKLFDLFHKMQKYLHLNDKSNGYFKVIKLFTSIIFFDHLMACSWMYLAQNEIFYGSTNTWFQERNIADSYWQTKYLNSLYFTTTTMITVGYGDITPKGSIEIGFCLMMMIMSSGMFAYSLNKFGEILKEMYEKDLKFQFLNSFITSFKFKCILLGVSLLMQRIS